MKQAINFYYSLEITDLFIENGIYHFTLSNDDYYFVYYNRSIEDLKDLLTCIYELKQKNIDAHEIVLNNKKEALTKIDDINYVLIKVHNKDKIIDLVDIIDYNRKLVLSNIKSSLYRNNWATLWSTKIDAIEETLINTSVHPLVEKTVDYYIGLAENAIYFLNNIKWPKEDAKIVLSRKRVNYPNYKLNYFNPLNFIFDVEVRDVAEYLKSMFFAGENPQEELISYLKIAKLSPYSCNMLFARLLYPSYYFDVLEKVLDKKVNPDALVKIIQKNESYENFLKKAYEVLSSYAQLDKIEWLISQH